MKNILFSKSLFALLLAAPLLGACDKDNEEPTPDEDNEQITTVRYELTPVGGGTPVTVQYRDPDGDGGTAPTIGTLTLAAGTTYTGKLVLLDETKNPVVVTSDEVKEEADEHLFFFEPSNVNLTISRTDKDEKGLEVGLETRVVAGAANAATTTGTLKITLRHQPGAKNGTFAPGDTDVEVNFPTAVR
ncbi:hypothetical protein [Hymenobacter metallicola]|uniref:Type 1 periplasmic binding fold superfamily protein n=1 Tax=Hymenobacter metallicola TaxID=2563114 RepID=A0A4Z0Q8E8_9BACT|nr:hypothetical protein [Hymenobacter metallicola]TGE26357.1 hypothetical protein E5K02_16300 [Hymenobacter metallicola]